MAYKSHGILHCTHLGYNVWNTSVPYTLDDEEQSLPHGSACVAQEQLRALHRESAPAAMHRHAPSGPVALQLDPQSFQRARHVADVFTILQTSRSMSLLHVHFPDNGISY